MNSYTLGAIVNIDNAKRNGDSMPSPLKATLAHEAGPSNTELDDMTWGTKYNGPAEAVTPSVVENSFSTAAKEVDALQSWTSPYMNRYRLLAACLMQFGNGLNDSAPGALIPYIEKDYHIGYAIVSLIFVTNAVGFISAVFFARAFNDRFGRAKTLMFAQALMLCGYIPIVCRPPFPVVVLSFLFLGLGMATNLAMNNTFCANLANSTPILGALHGSYGLGGTVGPLMATAIASHRIHWSIFYFISIAVTAISLVLSGWSFWSFEKDASVQPSRSPANRTTSQASSSSSTTTSDNTPRPAPALPTPSTQNKAHKLKVVILGALFIFAYQGAEVSISGWIISFLITYRSGNPAQVGYVTAGFWAGITLGRFALVFPAHRIGEKLSVAILTAGAVVFELLVWVVPNVVGNAVAVAFVGLLLGPIYPCATTVFSRLIPKSAQISSLGFISALGSSGGAVAPFTTGLLAQAVGTFVLHPICIALFVLMEVAWGCLPRLPKKNE